MNTMTRRNFLTAAFGAAVTGAAGGTYCETICCCSVDAGCALCDRYDALGEAALDYRAFDQKRRYTPEVDLDACIGCGTCEQRCPMHAVIRQTQDALRIIRKHRSSRR